MEIIRGKYRIKWRYKHHLNRVSCVDVIKMGEYYGKIKHTYKHWNKSGAEQMARVHFDGNKRSSVVPFNELEKII